MLESAGGRRADGPARRRRAATRRSGERPRARAGGGAVSAALAVASAFPPGVDQRSSPRGPGRRPPDERAGSPPEMVVAFLGLTGPSGVLPQHYTSLVIERLREKDYSLCATSSTCSTTASISLFYRAWEKYRFPIAYERVAAGRGRQQRGSLHLVPVLPGRAGHGRACAAGWTFDDEALLYYAGHFAHYPRSADRPGDGSLADYFELPVDVRQFQGQWLYLSRGQTSRLAARRRALAGRACNDRNWARERGRSASGSGTWRASSACALGPARLRRVPPLHALGRRPAAAVPDDPHLRGPAIRFRRPAGAQGRGGPLVPPGRRRRRPILPRLEHLGSQPSRSTTTFPTPSFPWKDNHGSTSI